MNRLTNIPPAMRQVVDIVVRQIEGGEHRRDEIAKIMLSISREDIFDAGAVVRALKAERST